MLKKFNEHAKRRLYAIAKEFMDIYIEKRGFSESFSDLKIL